MIRLRSLAFHSSFYALTLVIGFTLLPFFLLPQSWGTWIPRLWVRGSMWLLANIGRVKYEFRGRERLPSGPFILASKHESAWDTLIFLREVKNIRIIMKRELLWLPVFGWYCWKYGMIPVERSAAGMALRRLIKDTKAAMSGGSCILIFPEGTRVTSGKANPYQPGVAALYAQLGVPVVPVALNSGDYWPRRSLLLHPGTIRAEYLTPLEPGIPRKEFLAILEDRIEAGCRNLTTETERP